MKSTNLIIALLIALLTITAGYSVYQTVVSDAESSLFNDENSLLKRGQSPETTENSLMRSNQIFNEVSKQKWTYMS